jgi:5-methylcytosine-specific restriction enzyme A
MPMAPPQPCRRCGRIHCTAHVTPTWDHQTPTPRIRGRALQRIRAELFGREPWCRLCIQRGVRTRAVIVDHILNLADGGRDEPSNRQPLCEACHDTKTHAEAQRGRSWPGGRE